MGLPRESVPYEDTWIYTLKRRRKDLDFIPIFKRSLTSESLNDKDEFLEYYNPEIVILQIGIVDCAPRYIKRNSLLYKVILSLPSKAKTLFWSIYKKVFKRSIKRVDVPITRFENNLRNYCDLCKISKIQKLIIIKICTPSQSMSKNNPLILKTVKNYNAVLDGIGSDFTFVKLLNPLNIDNDINYVDGYHANKWGNKLVADDILNEIASI